MFRYEGDNYYIQCQNYGDEVYVRTFSDMSTDESPNINHGQCHPPYA